MGAKFFFLKNVEKNTKLNTEKNRENKAVRENVRIISIKEDVKIAIKNIVFNEKFFWFSIIIKTIDENNDIKIPSTCGWLKIPWKYRLSCS